jgi:MULE transposase domain.
LLKVGILLTATGVDANGSLFPLAYAVVDAENDVNWLWFLQHLRNVLETHRMHMLHHEPHSLVFLSDRQKGLIQGVTQLFPGSPHAYCLRHLEENFRKKFKSTELTHLLWKAATAITEADFNQCLQDMKAINPVSVDWLLQTANPEHWADLYFKGGVMVM